MITTVLFDFYNTLYAAHVWFELEVRELPAQTLSVLVGRGVRVSPQQKVAARGAWRTLRREVEGRGHEITAVDGLRRVLREFGIAVPDDLPQIVTALQRGAYVPGREEPGMVACVRTLHARGYTLGIVSNALSEDFLRWSLTDTDILDCFSGIYASATVGYYKSSPKLFEAALRGLRAQPQETIHVGDSFKFDVLGARSADIRAVWYSPASSTPPGPDATAVISSLAELPPLLERLPD